MATVGHLGSRLEILFVEQDDEGNALQTVPVRLQRPVFSFAAYLDLFREAWEQRNEIRKGLELPPLPLPEAYRQAAAALSAEEAPRNGHTAGMAR